MFILYYAIKQGKLGKESLKLSAVSQFVFLVCICNDWLIDWLID
jgi:hypothetical protein